MTPNGGSSVAALSEDGSTVVGWNRTGPNFAAVRWTAATGLRRVHPPAWTFESACADVSADGSVVVGHGSDNLGLYHGFVWDAASDLATELAGLPTGSFSTTRAVSDDGSLVMGLASDVSGKLSHVAWRVGTKTPLPVSFLPGAVIEARALRRTGPDTFTWVGTAWSDFAAYLVPVRFGQDQVIERVPLAPGRFGRAFAADGARDGTVVGHQVFFGTAARAYVCSPEGAFQLLETPPGWNSFAMAIAADGQRIVGFYETPAQRPVIWDRLSDGRWQARDPIPMLGSSAVKEWLLFAVIDVSADRGTLAGIGYDLQAGAIRGWIARVPP